MPSQPSTPDAEAHRRAEPDTEAHRRAEPDTEAHRRAEPDTEAHRRAEPDIKPRSRDVTDGLEKAAARGMLRAIGMEDADFAKPQIGVGSSWNEITPCNLSLDRLAKAVKDGVHAA